MIFYLAANSEEHYSVSLRTAHGVRTFMPSSIRVRFSSLTLTAALLFTGAVHGAGVFKTDLLRAAFCSRPITIDGDLKDWPEAGPLQLFPFRKAAGRAGPEIAAVFAKHPGLALNGVELRLCHDHEFLYLGLRLSDASPGINRATRAEDWYAGGDGVAVHCRVAEGHAFTVLWWGQQGGRPRVSIRLDGWKDAASVGAQSAMTIQDGKGCEIEIRVPWQSLGISGMAGRTLDLVWEAAFSGVDRALLRTLPLELRLKTRMHSTFNFLTAQEKLSSRHYLKRPEWWGELAFGEAGDEPAPVQQTPRGSGIASWRVPQTGKPINADGKLGDWNRAWLRRAAPFPWAYRDRYAADAGFAWDDRQLYIAVRFLDGEPMFNTELAEKQMGFRGGDCVQLRLKSKDKVTNLCGWYDTKNRQPALTADGRERKEPNILKAGATEAFAPLPGGRGYVQEMAIPFAALTANGKAPVAGDPWRATLQLWWAGVDERFSSETSVEFEQAAPLHTRYELPHDAYVSLGVFAPDGRLLRWLVRNEQRLAGENVERWDGRDQWGKILPAGDYTLKGIHHEPLKLEHVMTATNPGRPPWWTLDGKGGWLSDQAAPQAAVTDGENVYLAAPYAEAGHAIIAVGPDGKRIWGAKPHVGTPRCVSLALMGDRLYAMFSGPELTANVRKFADGDKTAQGRAMLMCFDKRTGELAGPSVKAGHPIKFTTWKYRHEVNNLWDLRLKKTFSPTTYGGMHRYSQTGMCETTSALGLAAVGGKLVASMFYTNELLVLDPDTVKVDGRIALPAPAGLHGLADGNLLAVSGRQVVKVNLQSKSVTPVIREGLSAPFGVTTDAAGNIYVSDWGDSFQVKSFRADGTFIRAFGKVGGRPWIGDFTPEAMSVPRCIAVTGDGKLWVAEDEFSPRRVSVWDAATGKLIRDYIGPANYRGWGLTLDPRNPERVITCGTEFVLDFKSKTFTPIRKLFLRRSRDDVFTPDGNAMGAFSKLVYRDGKEFLINGNRDRLTIMIRRGDEYRPVAAVSGFEAASTIDGTEKKFWDSDLRYHYLPNWQPEFFKGHAGDNHIWNDLNGDTIVQADEVTWLDDTLRRGDKHAPGRIGEWGVAWGLGFGPGWEIYVHGFCSDAAVIHRLDPEFSADGLPRYSFDRCHPIITHKTSRGKPRVHSLYASTSGKLFVTYFHSINREFIAEKSFVCYDREGTELWSIAGPPDLGPKSFYGCANAEFSFPELGSGVITWVWWHNGRAYLVTDDGLYLAGFLDNDLATGPKSSRLGGETSSFAIQSPDGRLYLVNGANSSHHILEIKGIETARRFEQKLPFTKADVSAATRASGQQEHERERPAIAIGEVRKPPAVDGKLDDWGFEKESVHLTTTRKPGRGGSFALKTHGPHLFLAARILDETPMVNNGKNWQTPFISGDCVDLMLATNATADPERRRAVEGDLRLLLTELNVEPLAVVYRPVVPGTKSPVQMLATTIDEVVRLDNFALKITREKNAYALEARVPLAAVGLAGLPQKLRGDVGIIYGDATGRDRDQRLYYYNRSSGMISDLTTEARLNPDRWGRVVWNSASNLLSDPGFERELHRPDKAPKPPQWTLGKATNGATARITTVQSFTGGRSLLLEQTTPVLSATDPTKLNLKREEFRQWQQALNDGKGGGFTLVDQWMPIRGGAKYNLRFAYRASGLVREMRSGRPGYAAFNVWLFWANAKGGAGHVWVYRCDVNSPQWQQIFNAPRRGHPLSGTPYTAPADATHACIRFQLQVNFPTQPKVFVDQVQFTPTE